MQSPGGFGLMWICIGSKEQGMKGKRRIQERKDSSAAALYIRLYKKNREVRVGWFSPGRDPQHQRLVPPWLALASRWWFLHLSFIFLCCFFFVLFCDLLCFFILFLPSNRGSSLSGSLGLRTVTSLSSWIIDMEPRQVEAAFIAFFVFTIHGRELWGLRWNGIHFLPMRL